jgi:hypothetical protein
MKTKAITILARYRVTLPTQYLSLLDRTHDPVRINGTRYARYTWHGVPGRLCDVIIGESVLEHRDDEAVVLEISDMRPHKLPPDLQDVILEVGEKAGKYDRAIRRRYALRRFPRRMLDEIPRADLRVSVFSGMGEDELTVLIRPHDGGTPLVDTFRRLRGDLDGYDMARIIGWHWSRYYRHIPHDDASALADSWAAEVASTGEAASWTLAEANRAASRALYRLSRDLGWRKLTCEERLRLGMPADAGQWHHESELAPIYERMGHPTGCGEATLRAASGGPWEYGSGSSPLTEAELLELEFTE